MKFFWLFLPQVSEAVATESPLVGVGFQALNFFLFLILLVYFVRKPLIEFFKKRRADFLEFEKQASIQSEKTQKEFELWKKKLEGVKKERSQVLEKAKKEVARFQMEKETERKNLKERYFREVEFLLSLEAEKIKREVLKEAREEITRQTRAKLSVQKEQPGFHEDIYKNFIKTLGELA